MGFRAATVVCTTSFLLGALFTNWIADSLTLWKSPVTDNNLWTAASYYAILAKGPAQLGYSLAVVVVLGVLALLLSLRDGEAGNIMFDGGSIFLFSWTIATYLYSVIPIILEHFNALPEHSFGDAFPFSLRTITLDLATTNLICSVALTGVLVLQAGRLWAERAEAEDEVEEVQAVEATKSS